MRDLIKLEDGEIIINLKMIVQHLENTYADVLKVIWEEISGHENEKVSLINEQEYPALKNPLILTLDEAVEFSGLGRNTILKLIHDKGSGFPYFKVGKHYRINRIMLEDYIQQITKEHREI